MYRIFHGINKSYAKSLSRVTCGLPIVRNYLVDHSWAADRSHPVLNEKQTNIIHVDFYETDTQYLLDADIPGTKKENVTVNLIEDNKVLMIEAKKKQSTEERIGQDVLSKYETKFHSRERVHGQQRRYIRLPDDADPDFITAGFQDGVLHVNIPKAEHFEPTGKTIPIK